MPSSENPAQKMIENLNKNPNAQIVTISYLKRKDNLFSTYTPSNNDSSITLPNKNTTIEINKQSSGERDKDKDSSLGNSSNINENGNLLILLKFIDFLIQIRIFE